jgi:hypothetical protein
MSDAKIVSSFRFSSERREELKWISDSLGVSQAEVLEAFIWAYYTRYHPDKPEGTHLGALNVMDLFRITLKQDLNYND